jgi:hypothetical protein
MTKRHEQRRGANPMLVGGAGLAGVLVVIAVLVLAAISLRPGLHDESRYTYVHAPYGQNSQAPDRAFAERDPYGITGDAYYGPNYRSEKLERDPRFDTGGSTPLIIGAIISLLLLLALVGMIARRPDGAD